RRERDSNPRRAFDPYTLSRGAPSTTRPSLRPAECVERKIPRLPGQTRDDTGRIREGKARGVSARDAHRIGGFALAFALVLDALEDLVAVHGHGLRCIDTDADLVALDAENSHGHFLTDHHSFTNSTGQNQHDGHAPS